MALDAGYVLEEELPDWETMAVGVEALRRGEKDFEPEHSVDQSSKLERARNAMYKAISEPRGHSLKQRLFAVYVEGEGDGARVFVPHPRGNYFKDMGKSKNYAGVQGGVVLSSWETLYLVERGSMVCYYGNVKYQRYLDTKSTEKEAFDYDSLTILSLQHLQNLLCTTPMVIEKYQTYSYLKRLGYLILEYQSWDKYRQIRREEIQNFNFVQFLKNNLLNKSPKIYDPRKHYFSYTSVFQSLIFINHYSRFDSLSGSFLSAKYHIDFCCWKPTPKFSKKDPPLPDFHISVVNINKTPFPTLADIQALHNQVNYLPEKEELEVGPPKKTSNKNFISKREVRQKKHQERLSKLDVKEQKKKKFEQLRDKSFKFGAGRQVVVAAIYEGVLSFINLVEGDFSLAQPKKYPNMYKLNPSRVPYGLVWTD